AGRSEEAAHLRDAEAALAASHSAMTARLRACGALRGNVVDVDEVASIIADWTGVPVGQIDDNGAERLLTMEEALHERIVGQRAAVSAVTRAVRRSAVGLGDHKRPRGSFLFLGPTGVGKTELAKTLAEFLFGDESALITLDMSEY